MLRKVKKRGTRIKRENCGYNSAGFDNFKSEILSELKRVKYRDLEDMVYRLHLTYDEIVVIFYVKYIAGSNIGYILPPGLKEIIDIILTLKTFLPRDVKIKITIDNIRLKSNLTTNKTTRFTKKSFFYPILGFTQ